MRCIYNTGFPFTRGWVISQEGEVNVYCFNLRMERGCTFPWRSLIWSLDMSESERSDPRWISLGAGAGKGQGLRRRRRLRSSRRRCYEQRPNERRFLEWHFLPIMSGNPSLNRSLSMFRPVIRCERFLRRKPIWRRGGRWID